MIYNTDPSTTAAAAASKFASETIAYAVFIQPARSIQNDTNLAFLLKFDFDLNYCFWVDTGNTFTAGLTAARDFENREKNMTVRYPQLDSASLLSHTLSNDGRVNSGGFKGLWGKVSNALSKGKDIYKIISPYLGPALGAVSPMLGAAASFSGGLLKEQVYTIPYDPKGNVFWLNNIHKELGYITPSPHPDIEESQAQLKSLVELLIS